MDRDEESTAEGASDRRAFLAKAGRFALVTPPALTLLVSTSLSSSAIARSGKGVGPPPDKPGHRDDNPGNHRGWR